MKVAVMVNKANFERYTQPGAVPKEWELVFLGNGQVPKEKIIATDAEALLVDPMCPITADIIERLPRLKIIHSQGVAYNLFDLEAAKRAGIYVCNCAGVNAIAVAEQALLLILALLRNFREFEDMVYAAKQHEAKTSCFENGLRELGDCQVGIIGLGAIGQELARLLKAFGCRISYFSRTPKPESGLEYLPLEELYARCDIISLHVPVTPATTAMINDEAINKMKPGAILINTARGELVDQAAVCQALLDGRLGGAGFDTLAPEPVRPDNPFLALPVAARKKVALSPHIGGITAGCFYRSFDIIWRNLKAVAQGGKPTNIVNGL